MISRKKLRKSYVGATSVIMLLLMVGQCITYSFSNKLRNKGHLINIAGRQRMLSQRLSKHALLLYSTDDDEHYSIRFQTALSEFILSYQKLKSMHEEMKTKFDDFSLIDSLYAKADNHFQVIKSNYDDLLNSTIENRDLRNAIEADEQFLATMDKIVFHYDEKTEASIGVFTTLGIAIFIMITAGIIAEVFFVFRPLEQIILMSFARLKSREEILKQVNFSLKEKNEVLKESRTILEDKNIEIHHLLKAMENKVFERTVLLNSQNEKFREYIWLNSHKVRAPLATLLGALYLIDYSQDTPSEITSEYLNIIQKCAEELDVILKEMNATLEKAQFFTEETPTTVSRLVE